MGFYSFLIVLFIAPFLGRAVVFGQSECDSLPVVQLIDYQRLQKMILNDSGKVVLVNVWATWCEPCKEEMPSLLKLKNKFPEHSFRLILLSADDNDVVDSLVRPMLKKFDIDFITYLIDEDDDSFITHMSSEWSGAIPTSFIYRNGTNYETMVGERTFKEFKNVIQKYLSR